MCAIPVQASLIGRALGQYQVEALIGRGAMGTVYLAKDLRLNRLVALKVLLGSYAQSSKAVQQFHAEAHAAAPLRHENIVRIYTAGTEENIPYIAMEFVDGEPLDRFLRRKGKVDWPAALYMAGQVAMALDCAHEHGVVHRDIKPSNIMLDRKGRVRLTDFGIARMQSEGGGTSGSSRFVGTPQYMSPEQCMGKPVGPQSDLFSLGVCLYQMISGQMPFEGDSSMALIKAICTEDPPRLNKLDPAIPDDVSRIVAYLMEKEPDMRPASARTAHALMRRTRKQAGGQSAVATSITEFLKDETEPRPFSRVFDERQSGATRKSTIRRPIPTQLFKRLAQAGVIAACVAAAVMAPIVLASRSTAPGSSDLVALRSGGIQVGPLNERTIALDLPGYRVGEMTWSGDSSKLVVRHNGRSGALTEGKWGVLLASPERGEVTSLISPGALTDSSRTLLDAAPYADGIILAIDDPASGDVVVMSQPYSAGKPDVDVRARVPRFRWSPAAHADAGERHSGGVSVSRDGSKIALMLWDPVSNGFGIFVNQQEPGDSAFTTTRTSRRGAIVPGSITFSGDGARIAYLRQSDDSYFDLWAMSSNSDRLDGELVALRVVGHEYALSPDGRYIAAVTAARDDTESSLRVFDIESGQTMFRQPRARVSQSAWQRGTSMLVYAARDEAGGETLFAIAADGSNNPRPLRGGSLGSDEVYSVAPNGQWVAISARDGLALTFLALNDATRRSRAAAGD